MSENPSISDAIGRCRYELMQGIPRARRWLTFRTAYFGRCDFFWYSAHIYEANFTNQYS